MKRKQSSLHNALILFLREKDFINVYDKIRLFQVSKMSCGAIPQNPNDIYEVVIYSICKNDFF